MTGTADKLQRIFAALGPADQHSLLAFAEFLQQRESVSLPTLSPGRELVKPAAPRQPLSPDSIPRPESESVIKAVKRLSATYHMLDKNALLSETSDLVTQHVIMGRDKIEVIDDLEAVFETRYQEYLETFSASDDNA